MCTELTVNLHCIRSIGRLFFCRMLSVELIFIHGCLVVVIVGVILLIVTTVSCMLHG